VNHEADRILRILNAARTLAVVGMSADPDKEAHTVPAYLMEHGYRVIPVNPNASRILGLKSYARLADVPEPVDLVLIFRPSADVPPVVQDAIRIGARIVWMQLGIAHEQAADAARRAGLEVVMDRCMRTSHWNLLGEGRGKA
jgi:predicted CoA-binding protein